jgi:hypothetical protein
MYLEKCGIESRGTIFQFLWVCIPILESSRASYHASVLGAVEYEQCPLK